MVAGPQQCDSSVCGGGLGIGPFADENAIGTGVNARLNRPKAVGYSCGARDGGCAAQSQDRDEPTRPSPVNIHAHSRLLVVVGQPPSRASYHQVAFSRPVPSLAGCRSTWTPAG